MLKLKIIHPGEPETGRWTADMLLPGQVATVTRVLPGGNPALVGVTIRRVREGCSVLNHEELTSLSALECYDITPPEPVGTRIVMTVEV